jgi:hypothetical protein
MEENVRIELDMLTKMVLNWKSSYLQWAPPEGGDDLDFIAREFSEEISRHISPFVQRLYANRHLTNIEAQEFLDFCYTQVQDLRDSLSGEKHQE